MALGNRLDDVHRRLKDLSDVDGGTRCSYILCNSERIMRGFMS